MKAVTSESDMVYSAFCGSNDGMRDFQQLDYRHFVANVHIIQYSSYISLHSFIYLLIHKYLTHTGVCKACPALVNTELGLQGKKKVPLNYKMVSMFWLFYLGKPGAPHLNT